MRVPRHEATTAQLGAAYPFVTNAGPPIDRVVIGRELSGTPFAFDPFELYALGALTNPNMVVLGQVGRGKSALVKSYLYRQFAYGRRVIVIDPKGEYGALATALGGTVLRLRPGSAAGLDPLAVTVGDGSARLARVQSIVEAICQVALGRRLHVTESVALQVALGSSGAGGSSEDRGRPTLRAVAERLLEPRGAGAASLGLSAERLVEMGRTTAFALWRVLGGEFGAMFDGGGTIAFDSGLLVVDVSDFYRSDALSVLLVALFAALRGEIEAESRQMIFVIDEAWAVLHNRFAAAFLQSQFKLARSHGTANVLVVHRPSDLVGSSVGNGGEGVDVDGSPEVLGLLSDCETTVSYALSSREAELAQRLFGLNDRERALLSRLRRGIALWRVGLRSTLVEHRLSPAELALVDTDGRMRP